MKLELGLTLAAALGAAACIKNKETIVVQRDGALEVELRSEGGVSDLVEGYPLPLGGPWQALDESTLRWIEKLGPDTGSARTQANLERDSYPENETKLAVRARFESVAGVPGCYAPEGEPYRTALLQRETDLRVESKGQRTVYTFERTFAARAWNGLWALDALEEHLPEPLSKRIKENQPLSDEDWRVLTPLVVEAYERSATTFAREALAAVYVLGDANMPAAVVQSAVTAVASEIRTRLSEPHLRRIYAAITGHDPNLDLEKDASLNPDLIARDAIRTALGAELARAGVAQTTRNAIFERLEWGFTAFDATVDLQDEEFTVEVELPGTVVLGNFDELDGRRARWSFDGKALNDHAVVLRVVSVLE